MDVDYVAELNSKFNAIKKELEDYKKKIKASGLKSINGDKYTAIIKPRVSRKLNQAKALEVVKSIGADWLLKEVVDEDKLEDALYQHEVDANLFSDCVIECTTYAVSFKHND